MKKSLITTVAVIAHAGLAHGQGLYDIAPNEEARESSPITWNAGLLYNYDDNVSPTANLASDDEASSVNAYIGATLVDITPQTTWDVFVRLGGTFYLEQLEADGADEIYGQSRLGLNWAHRINERLRLSSRNYFAYELEPDYSYGFSTDRQLDEYFHYQTDNAVGYRWTQHASTYTGFTIRGVDYQGSASGNDRLLYSFYNQFRYRTSEQTVWTADYRYGETESSGTADDSINHFLLLGVEHRFSPQSVIAVKGGMQMRDVDGGADEDSPFMEAAIRTRMNEQLSVRAFTRYSIEDYGTSFDNFTYDTNETLRVGISSDYILSPQITLQAGVNLIFMDMQDGRLVPGGAPRADADTDLINLYLGCAYKINDGLFLTGSYNWTDSDSDLPGRTYERNRVSIGLRTEF
ncbi:MAG: hypothetical protein ACPIB0_01805 [Akkermansiaceae bacterium]